MVADLEESEIESRLEGSYKTRRRNEKSSKQTLTVPLYTNRMVFVRADDCLPSDSVKQMVEKEASQALRLLRRPCGAMLPDARAENQDHNMKH